MQTEIKHVAGHRLPTSRPFYDLWHRYSILRVCAVQKLDHQSRLAAHCGPGTAFFVCALYNSWTTRAAWGGGYLLCLFSLGVPFRMHIEAGERAVPPCY